jgi:hypothetical protein
MVLQEALYMAVKRLEWLQERVHRKNPYRKGTTEWTEWENHDAEEFISIADQVQVFKELLEAKP